MEGEEVMVVGRDQMSPIFLAGGLSLKAGTIVSKVEMVSVGLTELLASPTLRPCDQPHLPILLGLLSATLAFSVFPGKLQNWLIFLALFKISRPFVSLFVSLLRMGAQK